MGSSGFDEATVGYFEFSGAQMVWKERVYEDEDEDGDFEVSLGSDDWVR